MEIRQLRYIDYVAQYSNFSKAANELHVSQQTLSQQIMKLEDEIGFQIFERTTRFVKLTRRGEQLLQKARVVLINYDDLVETVASLHSQDISTIQLGILPTFSSINVLEFIHGFQSKYHGITVNLQIHKSGTLLDMLQHGQVDAVIANISDEEIERFRRSFQIESFSEDYVCAIVNDKNTLACKSIITGTDLNHKTLLLLEQGSSIRKYVELMIHRSKITPAAIIDCPEIHSMMGLLKKDTGVGFLSSKVAAQYASKPICSIPIEPPIRSNTSLIFSCKNHNRDELNLLIEYMRLQTDNSSQNKEFG